MDAPCQSSVSANTVASLKKIKGGIPGVIKELKSDHGITAKHDNKGNRLTLYGDDDDILDLGIYMLDVKAGVSGKRGKKELGGNCTVKWTFTDRQAVNIKRLFGAETSNLKDRYKATLSDGDPKARKTIETVTIACPYESYSDIDSEINKIENKLNECIKVSEPISSPDDNQHAKDFAKKETDTFYCEYEKDELTIWGKNRQNCDNGLEEWRKVLNQLKPTKGADAGEQTMSEKENGNVTQHTPTTDSEAKDNEGNKDSFGRNSPHDMVNQGAPDDVVGTSAMDIDKREVGKKTGSGKSTKYSFNVNGLNVYVYNTSITDIKDMDAITNAANERMAHGGGVAYYISKAAGSKMDDDCSNYIKQNSRLSVTENYVSIPGKLKCKGIIHAVGPTWSDYRDKKECAFDLQSTIWKVLEATKSRSWRKVAIPAISSGIFGVPKALCADMYVKAFIEYGHIYGDVVEVHFIDLNQEILDLVIKAHTSWANKTSSLEFDNALKYGNSQNLLVTQRQGTRGSRDKSPAKQTLQFDGVGQTTYGERMFRYRVGDRLNLRVYCGDFTKLNSVNVVAVPVTKADGGLINIFKNMYKTYSSYIDRHCKKGSTEGSVHLFETAKGLPDIANIVLTSLDHKRLDKKLLYTALQNLFRYKYKHNVVSLAVPLIGLGHIDVRNHALVDQLCECIINSVVDIAGERLYLREIHLVNIERDATDRIQTILKQRTLSAAGHDMVSSVTQPQHMHAQQQHYQQFLSVEWRKHAPVDVRNDKEVSIKTPAVSKGAKCTNHAEKEAVASLNCGKHNICKVCQPNYSEGKCLKCKPASLNNSTGSTTSKCPICQDVPQQPKSMPCSHIMCSACYEEMMKHKPQCPICGYIVGTITGTQPPGDMFYGFHKRYDLPGFEKEQCGTIVICYRFPDGKQQENHPQPGRSYKGIERNAFLPNNEEGNDTLQLLRIAFDRKLIFTIGDSTTTGREGVITWNDIHHKTNPNGGQQNFGYPDPTYLRRVREELTDKGVKLPEPKNKLYPDLSKMKF